eukprot:6210336-Pleurochrysis_carterae.AAC.1
MLELPRLRLLLAPQRRQCRARLTLALGHLSVPLCTLTLQRADLKKNKLGIAAERADPLRLPLPSGAQGGHRWGSAVAGRGSAVTSSSCEQKDGSTSIRVEHRLRYLTTFEFQIASYCKTYAMLNWRHLSCVYAVMQFMNCYEINCWQRRSF